MRIVTFAASLAFAAALLLPFPLPALGQESILRIQDSAGNIQQVICRPATSEEQTRLSQSMTRNMSTATPPALPISPAQAPATPAASATGVSVPSPQPGYTAQQVQMLPGNTKRLYADPADIASAFSYYVPRRHAFTLSRGLPGPDPAVHGTLPPLKNAALAAPVRSSPTPAAAPKPAPAAAVPTTASATPASSAQTPQTALQTGQTGSQLTQQTAPTPQTQPQAASATGGASTPGTLPTPAVNAAPSLPGSGAGAASPAQNAGSGTPVPGAAPLAVNGAATPNPLLNGAPVMPDPTPRPRGVAVQ